MEIFLLIWLIKLFRRKSSESEDKFDNGLKMICYLPPSEIQRQERRFLLELLIIATVILMPFVLWLVAF